ncbi:MAG: SIR2 family protein [Lachnospiraceae bacterium]
MGKIVMVLGNGFTIDFIKYIRKESIVNTANLFYDGDAVAWPDGSNTKGFLSYSHCKNLWNLGARPKMEKEIAQEIIEEIISCANTLPRDRIASDITNNIYVNAYFELAAYLKHLFIMYDNAIKDSDITGANIAEWGWYKLLSKAFTSPQIEEIHIITYNYDLFLERVLRLNNISFDIVGIDEKNNKVKIYKPHGSISFCHREKGEKEDFSIRRDIALYEAELSDFVIGNNNLDENYLVSAMIPPSGDSSRMTFKWASDLRKMISEMISKISAEDKLIISGISYWHVDRKEIDEILISLPPDINAYMVNPYPPKSLDAVMTCLFEKYVLFVDSKRIGELA